VTTLYEPTDTVGQALNTVYAEDTRQLVRALTGVNDPGPVTLSGPISAPGSNPSIVLSAGGQSGVYQWAAYWITGTLDGTGAHYANGKTLCGSATGGQTLSSQQATATPPGGAPQQTIGWGLCRTKAGGSTFYLVTESYLTAYGGSLQAIIDNTPDSSLTTLAPSSNTTGSPATFGAGAILPNGVAISSAGGGKLIPNSSAGVLGTWTVEPPSAAAPGLIVIGLPSQGADLQEWQNNVGTILAKVDANGNLTAQAATFATVSGGPVFSGEPIFQGGMNMESAFYFGSALSSIPSFIGFGWVDSSAPPGYSSMFFNLNTSPLATDGPIYANASTTGGTRGLSFGDTSGTYAWIDGSGNASLAGNVNIAGALFPSSGAQHVTGDLWVTGTAYTSSTGGMAIGVANGNGWLALEATGGSENHIVSLNAAGSASQDLLIGGVGLGALNNLNLIATQTNASRAVNLGTDGAGGQVLFVDGKEALWYNGTYASWGYGLTSYNYFGNPISIGTTSPGGGVMLDVELPTAGNQEGVMFSSTLANLLFVNQLSAAGFSSLSQAGDQGMIFYGAGSGTGALVIGRWDNGSNGIRIDGTGVAIPALQVDAFHAEDQAQTGPQWSGTNPSVSATTINISVTGTAETMTIPSGHSRYILTTINGNGAYYDNAVYAIVNGTNGATHTTTGPGAYTFADTWDLGASSTGSTSASVNLHLTTGTSGSGTETDTVTTYGSKRLALVQSAA